MFRARETLCLALVGPGCPFLADVAESPAIIHRELPERVPETPRELSHLHRRHGRRDVVLGFAGRHSARHPIHRSVARRRPNDELRARVDEDRWCLLDCERVFVGELVRQFRPPRGTTCISARVASIATWNRELTEPQFRAGTRCEESEVVVPDLMFAPLGH